MCTRLVFVKRFSTFHQRGEERDVGGLPPAGRQVQADLLQTFSQTAASVF